MTDDALGEVLTATEAVRLFRVDRRLLDYWENTGRLRPVRTLRGRRYPRDQVAALVDEHRRAEEQRRREEEAEARALREQHRRETQRPAHGHARRRALEMLHAGDVGERDPLDEWDETDPPDARRIVEGVLEHLDEIDATIADRAAHWTIDRMPVVDRNLLRIGVYELAYTETAAPAVIRDAVELARLLSTEESGRFVHGLLARVARDVRRATS